MTGGFFGLLPPVYSRSPGLFNFLLTASTLGPGGWILSQVLNWLNNWLDSGNSTCGLDFDYDLRDEKREENQGQDETKDPEGEQEVDEAWGLT